MNGKPKALSSPALNILAKGLSDVVRFSSTTVPTSADNKVYMPIGILYSTYQIYFRSCQDLYAYVNGSFQQIQPDLSSKANTNLSNVTTITNSLTSTAMYPLVNKLTGANITTAPSSDINTGLVFTDVNDNTISGFTSAKFATGIQLSQMSATNEISGTQKWAYFNVYVDSSGNDYADGSNGVRSTIASWSMPSSGYALSTLAQNTDYTAAESGYFYIQSITGVAYTSLYIKNSTAAMDAVYTMPTAGGWLNGYIPVAKGDKFSYSVAGSWTSVGFYFMKSKGDA